VVLDVVMLAFDKPAAFLCGVGEGGVNAFGRGGIGAFDDEGVWVAVGSMVKSPLEYLS
jgi:hypothetical protein